jgi:hypothetical protein
MHWASPVHDSAHVPLGSQSYGEQSTVTPLALVIVCAPSHVDAAGMHCALETSHTAPAVQSVLTVHVALHAVAPHAYASHETAAGALQFPRPSHVPANVSVPFAQVAAPQETVAPAKAEHVLVSTPSHCAAAHGLPASAPEQPGRGPWGAPTTAVHRPTVCVTSQASHWPEHAVSQQTASTQKPEVQASPPVHGAPLTAPASSLVAARAVAAAKVSARTHAASALALHVPSSWPLIRWSLP